MICERSLDVEEALCEFAENLHSDQYTLTTKLVRRYMHERANKYHPKEVMMELERLASRGYLVRSWGEPCKGKGIRYLMNRQTIIDAANSGELFSQ